MNLTGTEMFDTLPPASKHTRKGNGVAKDQRLTDGLFSESPTRDRSTLAQ